MPRVTGRPWRPEPVPGQPHGPVQWSRARPGGTARHLPQITKSLLSYDDETGPGRSERQNSDW